MDRRGQARVELKKYKEANEDFVKAKELDPKTKNVDKNIEVTANKMEEEKVAEEENQGPTNIDNKEEEDQTVANKDENNETKEEEKTEKEEKEAEEDKSKQDEEEKLQEDEKAKQGEEGENEQKKEEEDMQKQEEEDKQRQEEAEAEKERERLEEKKIEELQLEIEVKIFRANEKKPQLMHRLYNQASIWINLFKLFDYF